MADNNKSPSEKEEKQEEKQPESPSSSQEGKGEEKTEAPSKLPEKFQGKSAEEIADSYVELEKKLGDTSKTVEEYNKLKKNQEILAQAIYSDPELLKSVESAVKKAMGQPDDAGADDKKEQGDGEAREDVADVRRATENRIINDFSAKYGIDKLKPESRQEVLKKVGNELADMLDPTGRKSVDQVVAGVSLDKLPNLIEKAYFLSNMDKIMSGEGNLQDRDLASIGRMSSSSVKSDEDKLSLTDSEKKIANGLGISHEKYLKQKQALQSKE